ncbi:MAG: hypothetical protein AB8B99_14355 [Phormidesmis sp.]
MTLTAKMNLVGAANDATRNVAATRDVLGNVDAFTPTLRIAVDATLPTLVKP